jgi:hypothetical protein
MGNYEHIEMPNDGNCLLRSVITGVVAVRNLDIDDSYLDKLVDALRRKIGYMCLNKILELEVDVNSDKFCQQVEQILDSTADKTISRSDLISRLKKYNGGEYEKREQASSKKTTPSSKKQPSSSVKWNKLKTHEFVGMFPLERIQETEVKLKDVLDMFENYFFMDGIWIPADFIEFISDVLKVNVQSYVVNEIKEGYFFREQWGECHHDAVLLAFIPWCMSQLAITETKTRRTGERQKMISFRKEDQNH